MKSIVYRDGKALPITGIAITGGCLSFWWLLFFLSVNETMPWWFWLIASFVSVIALSLIGFFLALLIGEKAIVSERSLIRIFLAKKKEILKTDILLIADICLCKDRFLVVYPKGYDLEILSKHKSVFTEMVEKTKMIQKDDKLILFRKTRKMAELLEKFGYPVTDIVD